MKPILQLPLLALSLVLASCDSKDEAQQNAAAAPTPEQILASKPATRGEKIESVEITSPLNPEWVTKGKAIYDMKCLACHRLTGDKLVGPGWAGVTKRRKPEWIMNMAVNSDLMLETDETARKLLEQCLVRMPNQNLGRDEARTVLEFMRSNDGEK